MLEADAKWTLLTQIESLMLVGNKREACRVAAHGGLWDHALVIAARISPDLLNDITARFAYLRYLILCVI